ncbi:MAG: RNB domain-containing ribonuclease, partial [Gammaproteobacteria bacterium]|nr:RNB domain-containing ribonuclease [Gammaproteobacteria bacterium]
MSANPAANRQLEDIARQAMRDNGLEPDFPPAVQEQVRRLQGPGGGVGSPRDQRALLWCSIDNDDSRD